MDGMSIRLACGLLVVVSGGLAACGSDDPPVASGAPAGPLLECADGGANRNPLPPGSRAVSVVSGPLTLAYVGQYADQPARAFRPVRESLRAVVRDPSSTAHERRLARRTLRDTHAGEFSVAEGLVRVAAGREATLTVAPAQRDSVRLVYSRRARNQHGSGAGYSLAHGDSAITFRACDAASTDFLGGYVVAGARCVHLRVSTAGRAAAHLRIPFGTRCPRPVAADKVLKRAPYAGVACPRANSIACDRVGVAVWLKGRATRVSAVAGGRAPRLEPAGFGGRSQNPWIGYLQPAGLLDGALKVTPDRGRFYWTGAHPTDIDLRLTIRHRGGALETTRLQVPLRAGWG